MPPATKLDEMDISTGKKVRLHRLFYRFGPGRGKTLLLPLDHGVEHGPSDFFDNPDSVDPDYIFKLAVKGKYSGIVLHVGVAEKYFGPYVGRVPLVLKINGKTNIPSDAEAFSALDASVEDAVRLGADAVGYTLYVGSPSQDLDFIQCAEVRRECERLGMPLIIWSYPRGEAIEKKGGRDSLYAVDYAARLSCEMGADVVKLNEPEVDNPKKSDEPKQYSGLDISLEEAVGKVVRSAGKTLVLFSGGSKISDEDLLAKAELCMNAGAAGLIFGRNMWQRLWDDALEITSKVQDLMKKA